MVVKLISVISIFIFVKIINEFKEEEKVEKKVEPSSEEKLLTEIRDLLKK